MKPIKQSYKDYAFSGMPQHAFYCEDSDSFILFSIDTKEKVLWRSSEHKVDKFAITSPMFGPSIVRSTDYLIAYSNQYIAFGCGQNAILLKNLLTHLTQTC